MSQNVDPKETLLRLRARVRENSEEASRWVDLGDFLVELGEFDQAEEALHKAFKLNPKQAEAVYLLGVAALGQADLTKALDYFGQAVSLSADWAEAWSYLGSCQMEAEDYVGAERSFRKLANLAPQDAFAWRQLGSALFFQSRFEEALSPLTKGVNLEPEEWALERLGLSLSQLNRPEEALAALEKALSLNNERASLWNNLGNCCLKLQRVREAENAYRQALHLEPNNADFWFNLGELLYHYASKEEAIEPMQRVLQLHPEDREALELLAKAQVEKHPEAALESLERLYKAGDRSTDSLQALAGLYQKRGEVLKESQIREELSRKNPYDMENNFAIAKLKLNQGQPEIAYKLLGDCLSISEKEYRTWYKLAQNFRLEEKLEQEFDCLEKVIKANPEHLEAWRRLGQMALERGIPQKALYYFQKAKPLVENDLELYRELTYQLLQKQAWTEAIQAAESAVGLIRYSAGCWRDFFSIFKQAGEMPRFLNWLEAFLLKETDPEINMAFGDLLVEFGYFDLAESLYQRLAKGGENQEAQNQLAIFYQMNGRLEQAVECLLQGLAKAPKDYNLLNSLGECRYQQGRWEEAKTSFEKALQVRRDDYRVWFNLGNIAYWQKQYEKAKDHYQLSLEIYDEEPKTYYNLAKILEEEGDKTRAKDHYRKATQLNRWDFASWAALGTLAMEQKDYQKARRYYLKSLASNRKYKIAWNNLALTFVKLQQPDKTKACLEILKELKLEA